MIKTFLKHVSTKRVQNFYSKGRALECLATNSALRTFCTANNQPQDAGGKRKMTEGYHRTYKHDPRVSMIIKSSNHNLNMLDKHRYNTLIKF